MTTKPDWIKFKIPIFCAKDRVTVCTGIKNENSDYLIVLKIDIWKTEYCQLYWFSEHRFARTFQLHLSGLKSFFFRWYLCVNSRKGFSFCTCFISFIRDSRMILRDRELLCIYWNLGQTGWGVGEDPKDGSHRPCIGGPPKRCDRGPTGQEGSREVLSSL